MAGVETVGLPGLASGASCWLVCTGASGVVDVSCAAAGIATAINKNSSSAGEGRVSIFSRRASFRPEKKNGHADAVLDAAGCRAKKNIGEEAVSVRAHGHQIAALFLNPFDDFLDGSP